MIVKFVAALLAGFILLNAEANDKIIPDFAKLAPEWKISGNSKITEENGIKYIKMEAPDKGFSSLAYKDIQLAGVKQVKISLKYRTNVAKSSLHSGAWFYVALKGADDKFKSDGFFLSPSEQWAKVEKTFDIPASSSVLRLELRLQDARDGHVLDANDICIELIK